MNVTQLDDARESLKDLRIKHRSLDQEIINLSLMPTIDNLEIRRMKKHKLLLKEMILKLESNLIPDLEA